MAPVKGRALQLYTSELKALHRFRPALLNLPQVVYVEDILSTLAPILSQADLDEIQLKRDDLDIILEMIHRIELYDSGFTQLLLALRDPGVEQIDLAEKLQITEREERIREERQVLISLFKATGGAEWIRNDNWCSAKDIREWYGVEQNLSTGDLTSLKLAGNNLVGELPQGPLGITTLRRMRVCHLQLNALEGEFPQDWMMLEHLQEVKAHGNLFRGPLPRNMEEATMLERLELNDNDFEGDLPRGLGLCNRMVELRLNNNRLSGEVPSSFGKLYRVTCITLEDNELQGSLPAEMAQCTALEELYLGKNQLSGSFPPCLLQMARLERLSLRDNRFQGPLPSSLGAKLVNIRDLSLQSNLFTGKIGSSIGCMLQLRFFEATNNQLEGPLPSALANCVNLEAFRCRNNRLTGLLPLPTIRRLSTLQYLSATGNPFTGLLVSSRRVESVVENEWTELTWLPDSRPGTYTVTITDPDARGRFGAYGTKAGTLAVQIHDKDENKWRYPATFIPALTGPYPWVVPFSRHLTAHECTAEEPLTQTFESQINFDGIRVSTCAWGNPNSGGRVNLELAGEAGMKEARRMLNIIFGGELKIWF